MAYRSVAIYCPYCKIAEDRLYTTEEMKNEELLCETCDSVVERKISAPQIDTKGCNHTFVSSPRVSKAWGEYKEKVNLQVEKANAKSKTEKEYVQKKIDNIGKK